MRPFFVIIVIRFQLPVAQVSVWSYDRVQENQFLGAVNLPLESLNLSEEHVAWYRLGQLHM